MIELPTTSHRKLDFITMTIYHLAHGVNYGVLQDVFGLFPSRISEVMPIVLEGLIRGTFIHAILITRRGQKPSCIDHSPDNQLLVRNFLFERNLQVR
jgi:hypothetical protein